jgi:hypothetical protein
MRPGETVRFACDECRMAFDITMAPPAEWREPQDDKDYRVPVDVELPHFCPFCELGEVRTAKSAKAQTQSPERRPHGTCRNGESADG